MFDFKGLENIILYDFKNLFKQSVPKGNIYKEVNDKNYDNINTGAIIKLVGYILTIFAVFGVSNAFAKKNELFLGGVNLFGIQSEFSMKLTLSLVIPIAIFAFCVINKGKKQAVYPYFVTGLYCVIDEIVTIFRIISWFASMFISPLFGFLGLISVCVNLLSNLFIFRGCTDFCLECHEEYENELKKNTKKEDIILTPIKESEISLHNEEGHCSNCNAKLRNKDKFCPNCGGKLN